MPDEPKPVKIGYLQYMRILWGGKAVLREAATQAALVKAAKDKSSWRSTEFLQAVLLGLGAVLAQAGGLVPAPYGSVVLAVSAAAYAVGRGLVKRDDSLGGVKPGTTTTEFWLNLLNQVAAVLSAASGAVDPAAAAILLAVSNAAYSFSRSLAKSGAQPEASAEEAALRG